MATLVAWVGSSLLIGLSTYRVTRNVLLGISAQVLVFAGLNVFNGASMHPGALICLLLAGLVALTTFVTSQPARATMGLLGVTVGALLLTKVNIGIFALASVLMACAATYPSLARSKLRPAIELGFVVTPLALMAGQLEQSSTQRYSLHVAIAALTIVLLLRVHVAERARSAAELWWFAGGLLGAIFLTCLMAIVTGTSVVGLFEGVISDPLNHANVHPYPLLLENRVIGVDVVSLVGASSYWYVMRFRRGGGNSSWYLISSLLSIFVGVVMALSIIGEGLPFDAAGSGAFAYQLTLLGLAWVSLVPVSNAPMDGRMTLAVRLLPTLAVLQSLHAYPVAGPQQIAWSSFLLVPVAVVCLSNGIRGVAAAVADRTERRALAAVGFVSALVLIVFLANTTLRRPLIESRNAFNASASLNLPGASRMQAPPEDGALLREITDALNERCAAFLTFPGMNSFYLWTGQDPPTDLNAGYWMELLDTETQSRVVAASSSLDDLCLLRNKGLVAGWYELGGGPSEDAPLVRFVRQSFTHDATFGPFELLRRESP